MAASENKTQPTDADVEAYLASVEHPVRRRDARRLVELLSRVTGERPRLWGPSIVGFGSYHYRYPSGREGDTAAAGFSPRKAATTVYLMDGVDAHADLLERLGPHTVGKGCLYLKDLDAVDLAVLEEVVRRSYTTLTGTPAFGTRLAGTSEPDGS
ncbi:protein of unknown function (DU1801) [Cellulosimicrobium cellulans J1]|nr:protein of unknown function (DU1801) [Cellulosimicrobium cellulans J1]